MKNDNNCKLNATLIFLHIHKTAGSTLSMILERQFSADAVFPGSFSVHPNLHTAGILWGARFYSDQIMTEFRSLSDNDKRRLKYLHNHIPFGIHNELPQKCQYVTMLRNPVDRIISMYYYMKRSTHIKKLNNQVSSLDLEAFITSDQDDIDIPYGNNAQVYRISGMNKQSPATSIVLEQAKKNLNNHFLLAGLSERFDESLLILARKLNWDWKSLLYFKRQVGTNKPSSREISPKTRDLIEKHNQLDLELYEYARRQFENDLALYDESLQDDVKLFRERLPAYRSRPAVVLYNHIFDIAVAANVWLLSKMNK